MSTTSTPGIREAMAQANGIPVENKNLGDQLLKKTLTFDLDPELYDSWCNIANILNLITNSQIVAFLINFYLEQYNWTAKKNCETCGAGLTLNCLHCLTQHSPQFMEFSRKAKKTHLQKQLRAAYLLDKSEGDKNRTNSKSIAQTNQNPLTSTTPSDQKVDLMCQDASNVDSDGGIKTSVQDHAKLKPLMISLLKKKLVKPENRQMKWPPSTLQNLVLTVPLSKASDCFLPLEEAAESDVAVGRKMLKGSPQEKQMKMSLFKTTDSSSFAEIQTTEGTMDQINHNTTNDNDVGEFEPNPEKFKQLNSDLGPIPRTQNCIERLVEVQQKLKQEKADSSIKTEAENSPRLYKIIKFVKKGDIFSAPNLETVHVKTPVNNFDDAPIQGQPKNLGKIIYLLNKNVAPVPKVHPQSQAACNADCLQRPRMLLPVTSISHLEEDSDDCFQNASIDASLVTNSNVGDKTFDSSSFPELQTTDRVIDQIDDNTSVEGQLKLNQEKIPEKCDAEVLPPTDKAGGRITNCKIDHEKLNQRKFSQNQSETYLLKNSDIISAPAIDGENVKSLVNNVDNTPKQGLSNKPEKMIDLLKNNVFAPVPKAHQQVGETNNISHTNCTQGPSMLLPVTLKPIFKKEEDKVASSPILLGAISSDSNKIAQGQNLMTLIWLPKKIDAVPFPEVQSVNAVGNQVVKKKLIRLGSSSRKNLANENGKLKDPCVSEAEKFSGTYDLPQKRRSKPQSSIKKTFVCPVCDKIYTSALGYKRHKDQHVGNLTCCSICNKKFSCVRNLELHQQVVHQGLKPFKCELCGKQFSRNNVLRQHMLFHGEASPYTCSCGKAFKNSQHLYAHSKAVHISRDHVCEVCGKTFKLLKCLEKHRRDMHMERKRLVCEICGASLASRFGLQLHRSRHTGEPPRLRKPRLLKQVSCETCGKSYPSGYMKVHRRSHTGEKPYFCMDCCKTFTFNSSYRRHMSRIHKC